MALERNQTLGVALGASRKTRFLSSHLGYNPVDTRVEGLDRFLYGPDLCEDKAALRLRELNVGTAINDGRCEELADLRLVRLEGSRYPLQIALAH